MSARYVEVDNGRGGKRRIKVITCDCGTALWCSSFTNTCEGCGADYNGSGSKLAPRWQWGEETGEQASDMLVSDDALVAALDEVR